MDLDLIRRFVAVAETQSFRRAAAQLQISQPAVSRSIALLEEQAGVSLLRRNQRGVELTVPGRVLLEEAPRLMAHVDMVRRVTRHSAESNRLNVGFLTMALYRNVPEALRKFSQRWPGVDLRLTELSSAEQLQRLRDGTLDIGMVLLDSAMKHEMAMRIIDRAKLQFVVPADSKLAHKDRIALKELAGMPFIIAGRGAAPWLREQLEAKCLKAGFLPSIVHEANQIYPVLKLVAAGMGVGLVPDNARVHPVEGIRYLSVKDASWNEEAVLAMLWQDRTLPAVMKNFIQCVSEIAALRNTKVPAVRGSPRK